MSSTVRTHVEFESRWRFSRDEWPGFEAPGFDDRRWEEVRIPHDWAIRGPFDRDNDNDGRRCPGRTGGLPHVGKGFYRKHVTLPALAPSRRVRVEFDGVMSDAKVYCNGRLVGGRPYGYSSFAFDITDRVQPGENVIAVSAENLPGSSRWYPGAGIYRHARLVVFEDIHVAHWGVTITTRGESVRIRTTVNNLRGTNAGIELITTLLDPDGREAGQSAAAAEFSGAREFCQDVPVQNPRRWQPGAPFLYTALSTVKAAGRVADQVETRFGIRDLAFHPHAGFLINGTPMKIKGVCQHHDLGPLGAAVHRAALRRQLVLLRDMGCNAIRTAHNPPAPDLLDLCDEMGFLVMDEAFDEWREPKCPQGYHRLFDEWAERDLRDMIRRDRNHPSVILWSIGNEIKEQYLPVGPERARWLCDICRSEDPSRPTTAGMTNVDDSLTGGLFDAVDVKGFNYKAHLYSIYHHAFPDRPLFGSETAATVSTRGEYSFPVFEDFRKQDNLQVSSFDLCAAPDFTLPDYEFKAQDECPFVMGEFAWSGFDYLGEPFPYIGEWPARSSYFGILDLCGLPKDRYYLYQSRWSPKPVLHLMPHWTWPGREGRSVAVQCYTRFARAELFVNGVSRGIRAKNRRSLLGRYRLIWPDVVYEPGELKVVALDENGQAVAEQVVRTAGEPAGVELIPDREAIRADGEDMVFVTVRLTDRRGTVCPNADERITFDVSGPVSIAAVDNGDPTSLEPFGAHHRQTFHGLCLVYLRSNREPGDRIALRASCRSGTAQLEIPVV